MKYSCKNSHNRPDDACRGIPVVRKLIKCDELVRATRCIIAKTLRIDGKGKHSSFRMYDNYNWEYNGNGMITLAMDAP